MEDFLIALLQCVFEFLADIFCYGPFDWPFEKLPGDLTYKCITLFIIGAGLAWISVLFLKHTWISFSAFRIANLALAPLTSAFISEAIARYRRRQNASVVPRNHFWQAFWFTLGVVTVRFAYAVRH